jgi:hypothetical protein
LRHELLMGDAQPREAAGQEADKDPLRARYLAWLDERIVAVRPH